MNTLPISQSQVLIWTGQHINPDSPLYNMAFSFDLKCAIDVDRFRTAFQQLVRESDALRSKFVTEEGIPRVVFQESFTFQMDVLSLEEKQVADFLNERVKRVFDLDKSLFDALLIRIDDGHYIFYINQHHIITDGWAFALLYNRLMNIYSGRDQLKLESYEEFLLKGSEDNLEKHQNYWKRLTENAMPLKAIYGKQNDDLNTNSSRHDYVLKEDLVQKIEKLLQEPSLRTWSLDLGKFNFFLTTLASTIYRLNRQRKNVIGVPALNRINKKEKNTLGLFIEMFPIHSEIYYKETYESLYKKINQSANGFLKHAHSGVSTSQLNKTFNVVLNYINAKFKEFDGIEMTSEWLHPGASDPGHHLRLQITNFDGDGSLKLSFDFIDAVFNTVEKTRFMEFFLAEIQHFVKDSKSLIHQEEEAERKIIDEVNKTAEDFPEENTILDLFKEIVNEKGGNVAVTFEGESITYLELDRRSNQVAHLLKDKHVLLGDAVGVIMDRSIEMMIGLVGIMKSGGAYVPLDPLYPEDRMAFMKEDAEIEVVVDLETVKASTSYSMEALAIRPSPRDLIYIIYTSGSTGRPKGVMNQHSGVLNRLFWAKKEFGISDVDVILQKTNYTFDVSVGELFLPLITGARLVMASPGGHRDSDYLKEIVNTEKITSIHFVPPMLELFLLNLKKGDCSSLKHISCSGEVLKLSHVESCLTKIPQAQVYNLYGPTEAAIEVSIWRSPSEIKELKKVTIGKPAPNVNLRIVDEGLSQLGILTPGELLIGGVQVARGYKNRPELSKQKFIERDNLRWYRTGDLCQWLPDGEIEFLGRIDTQVKVRGFRVELEEIEQVAKEVEGVRNCVVLVKDQKIVAFVQGGAGDLLDQQFSAKLPDYMVPSRIIQISEIPFLNNGKIDRQALLNIKLDSLAVHKPENEFQEFVHGIWAEALDLDQIDIESNFFSEGGDSLSGIRVITHINAELDLELPVVLIFTKSTIAELALHIEAEIDQRMAES